MDDFADAVMQLADEVDRACAQAQEVLSNEEIAKELEHIAQGWRDAA